MRSLLSTSPSDRPSVAQLLSMPLLRRCIAAYAVTVRAKHKRSPHSEPGPEAQPSPDPNPNPHPHPHPNTGPNLTKSDPKT